MSEVPYAPGGYYGLLLRAAGLGDTRELLAEARALTWEMEDELYALVRALCDVVEAQQAAAKESEEYAAEGWAWVSEILRLGGWRDVFAACDALREAQPTYEQVGWVSDANVEIIPMGSSQEDGWQPVFVRVDSPEATE